MELFNNINVKELLIVGILFAAAIFKILSGRIYSNNVLKREYVNTLQGDPINLLPTSFSVNIVLGNLVIIGCIIWAFFISNWVGLVFILIYLLTNIVGSKLNDYKKIYQLGDRKKCKVCNQFREFSYYSINNENPDGHSDVCVACSNPEMWNTVQQLKKEFKSGSH